MTHQTAGSPRPRACPLSPGQQETLVCRKPWLGPMLHWGIRGESLGSWTSPPGLESQNNPCRWAEKCERDWQTNHPALGHRLVKTGKLTSGVPERPTRNFPRGVSLKFKRKLSTKVPPELKGGVSTTGCLPYVLLPIQWEEQKQAENTRTRKG